MCHVRATVNANIKYDRVTQIKLRESTQNLLFHLSILDSFLYLFRDVGATPGQSRAGVFPDNLNPMRKRARWGGAELLVCRGRLMSYCLQMFNLWKIKWMNCTFGYLCSDTVRIAPCCVFSNVARRQNKSIKATWSSGPTLML